MAAGWEGLAGLSDEDIRHRVAIAVSLVRGGSPNNSAERTAADVLTTFGFGWYTPADPLSVRLLAAVVSSSDIMCGLIGLLATWQPLVAAPVLSIST